jgi:hypothetical protein
MNLPVAVVLELDEIAALKRAVAEIIASDAHGWTWHETRALERAFVKFDHAQAQQKNT